MSTHDRLESRGFHGPPPARSEADDAGLGAFASEDRSAEWQSDFAEEDAPGEADAHQPFDVEGEAPGIEQGIEDIEPDLPSEPVQIDPVPPARSTPRWMFQAVRACVIFVLGLATFYYTQEPNRVKRTATAAAPKPSSMPAPASSSALHPEAPPQLAVPSAEREGGQSAPSADSRPAAAPIRSPSAKATGDRSSFVKAPVERSTSVAPAIESSAPAVAVSTPEAEDVPVAANNPEPAPVALDPINLREAELTQHRAAIRALLDAYRESYGGLDALSAARLWPGVDTAALSRAFSTLSSQQVDFDSCRLDLDQGLSAGGHYQRATALCSGSLTYTRRVGNASPQSRSLAWTFDLDRTSGRWLIRRVVAK